MRKGVITFRINGTVFGLVILGLAVTGINISHQQELKARASHGPTTVEQPLNGR